LHTGRRRPHEAPLKDTQKRNGKGKGARTWVRGCQKPKNALPRKKLGGGGRWGANTMKKKKKPWGGRRRKGSGKESAGGTRKTGPWGP